MTTASTLPKTLPAFFFHFLRRRWKWWGANQALQLCWALDHTLFPVILGMLIDRITQLGDNHADMWSALATPLLLGLGLWIYIEFSYRTAGFIRAYVIPQQEAEVRIEMFDYVQHHSYTYFSTHFAGSLANKIADMTASMTDILQWVMSLFVPVALALMMATAFFAYLQPVFALILATWICIHLGIVLFCAKKCDSLAHIHAESRSVLTGKIVDSFTNHLNVRLFARTAYEKYFLGRYQKDERQKLFKSLWYMEKMKLGMGLICFIMMGIILNVYMLYSWQKGSITTGEVVFIFNTSWNITMMAWLAGLELPSFFRSVGICKQALSIIQDTHEITDAPNAQPLVVKNASIVFDHVAFHYTPNHIIFRDQNVVIKAGEKIGLVGFSGSGKSTFVHLILRYFDVEEGRILIDGQDISLVTRDSLCSQIAMIPQDTILFHRTLMENIRYGRLDATDEEVLEASRKAHCHGFIEQLPEKYETVAGERGIKLSGGQRQRIAIARAILRNAPILILDEATAALDSVTEKLIQDGLEQLMENRTCIVIAHRLSTLCGMDRILVFKEGRIVEEGSHEELLAAEGHYAQMWSMQGGGFLLDSVEEE